MGLTASNSHSGNSSTSHKPFVPATSFSGSPTESEIFQKQVLPIVLTPTQGQNSVADNRALAAALTTFTKRTSSDDMSALTGFIHGGIFPFGPT
jgi:hypothetical protein